MLGLLVAPAIEVPPSFGLERPAVIDVPPSGERRPAVILVPPKGLARPGRAMDVPPNGEARPVGAGAGAGASPSEVGEGAASAAFRLSRAAAAFGRVIFVPLPRRRAVVGSVAFAAPTTLMATGAARRVVFSAVAQLRWRKHCRNAPDAQRVTFSCPKLASAPGTALASVLLPLGNRRLKPQRCCAERINPYE